MRKRGLLIIVVLCLLAAAGAGALLLRGPKAQEPAWVEPAAQGNVEEAANYASMKSLGAAIARELRGAKGKWAVYVEDLEAGISVRGEYRATCDDAMVSASIIKIFIMAVAYEDIDAGQFSEEALYSDIYEMITYSDNEATNRLVTVLGHGDPEVGMARVNEYAQSAGCPSTRMERLMLVEDGTQNYVSAMDCARLLRMMYEGQCVSAARSEQMLSIMKEQKWNDYIPKGPPEGTVIAHKGGDLIGIIQGDVGIVYDEKGPYIVCIICNDPSSFKGCAKKIAAVSRRISDCMTLCA